MPSEQSAEVGWVIQGAFRIEAEDEETAQRAMEAIERTARRTKASVTTHVHFSEATCS